MKLRRSDAVMLARRIVVQFAVSAALLLSTASLASAQDGLPRQAVDVLTLKQAEQTALQNNPQVRAVKATALAATQVVREARAAYFPTVVGSITGADAMDGSRVAAGGLNNPVIYDRFATGFTVSQQLTDFGRTHALVQGAALNADAQEKLVSSREADVLLRVDRAYFNVLRAQAVQRVAEQTVNARQVVADQVTALAQSNLKSGLDVSFARVSLGEAQLLLVQARNDVASADAELAAALGSSEPRAFTLADEPVPGGPPSDAAALVAEALKSRPELAAARFSSEAASRIVDAERSLTLPSVSAVGSVGTVPYRVPALADHYSALGININVPVTNGNLYAARRAEASYKFDAETQKMRDLENQIARDVRMALLDAETAYQRLALTAQILDQASQALDLAQARYDLGLSSIVELTQAQLSKTQAELAQASARYDFQARTAALRYQTGTLK